MTDADEGTVAVSGGQSVLSRLLTAAETAAPVDAVDVVSRREVAVALGWLERWAEALTEYRGVADARERVLGADHPDTLAAREDEAHCLVRLGHAREAAELHRRAAALRGQGLAGGA